MKTNPVKAKDIKQNWYLIDAKNIRLGKVATTTATYLIGKHKLNQADNLVSGDKVVIINAKEISVFPKKLENKKYYRHSGFIGGLRTTKLSDMLEKKPEEVIVIAVKGMLPKTKLRSEMLKNLHVYAGAEHDHEAQKPIQLEIK